MDARSSIRPFDIQRDMKPVADLVEICFAGRLNRDGKALIRKMRSSAYNKSFQSWAMRAAGQVSLPLSGYVWVENDQIIANLSLVPFRSPLQNRILIANVAVHPDHQRQGIARALVDHTIKHLKGIPPAHIWLQVEEDNQAAVDLYLKTGFREHTRRTTWILETEDMVSTPAPPPDQVSVTPRPLRHWRRQKAWLEAVYPDDIRWHFTLKNRFLRGGLWGTFLGIMEEGPRLKQWSAVDNKDGLSGVLTWQSSSTFADRLWLAAPPETEQRAIQAFFPYLARHNRFRRPLRLNYPPGRAADALQQVGFHPSRTLIWMRLSDGS